VKAILDTSILISRRPPPSGLDASISAVSIAELHFGIHVAADDAQRRERVALMGLVESRFPRPIPFDDRVARVVGQLKATVASRGGKPRSRLADLAIAATAVAHGAVLLTLNPKDLNLVKDLVAIRVPA